MEKIADVLYGKVDAEKGLLFAYLGAFEATRLKKNEYMYKLAPRFYAKELKKVDINIDDESILVRDTLDPIYIDFSDINSIEFSDENRMVIFIMKDGDNHAFVYDESEEGKTFNELMKNAYIVKTIGTLMENE